MKNTYEIYNKLLFKNSQSFSLLQVLKYLWMLTFGFKCRFFTQLKKFPLMKFFFKKRDGGFDKKGALLRYHNL